MPQRCLAMMTHGECAVVDPTKGIRAPVAIAKSVGKQGFNQPADVKAIQSALNDVSPAEGGPTPPLAVDGLCYGKTTAAIHKFQATFMKWPDDRIDPGGKTLQRLNAARGAPGGPALLAGSGAQGEISLLPNPYVVPLILSLLPDARKCLKAAETEFLRAMPFVDLPASNAQRQQRMQRINLHFAIDSFPSQRSAVFHEAYNNIKRASLAVARHHSGSEALFLGVFEPNRSEKMEKEARAYTFAGGYHRVGVVDPITKLRTDLIYICSRLAQNSRDFQVMAIVHELAHFVGQEGVNSIDDHGYGWIDDPRMKRLVPWQRLHNAQSYGNFAFHCGFNRSPFGPQDKGGPTDG